MEHDQSGLIGVTTACVQPRSLSLPGSARAAGALRASKASPEGLQRVLARMVYTFN